MKFKLIIAALLYSHTALANSDVVSQLMDDFRSQGVEVANAQNGEVLWNKSHAGKAPFTQRSCTSCHGTKPGDTGKHAKTGKAIKPMAPSVNKDRLTDVKKINKWFLRNCKWTLGRECSAQEKADILSFINQQ